jgi:glycosyltransferase involved in cell wall biosynthesis
VISVCLATYNGQAFIEAQLLSVLTQLGPDDEVVISDDGSTDETISIIKRLSDSRLRLLSSDCRLGVVKNFERALYAARGETIFLCDQDDIWLAGKIERCIESLKQCDLVVTDCVVVDGELKQISPSFFGLRHSGAGTLRNLWKNSFLGCCMAMRHSVLKDVLPFPSKVAMHDWWIGMVIQLTGRVIFLDGPLMLYRRHGGNASQAATHSSESLTTQLRWRIELVIHLLARLMRLMVIRILG